MIFHKSCEVTTDCVSSWIHQPYHVKLLNFPKINISLGLNSLPDGWQQIQREAAVTTAAQSGWERQGVRHTERGAACSLGSSSSPCFFPTWRTQGLYVLQSLISGTFLKPPVNMLPLAWCEHELLKVHHAHPSSPALTSISKILQRV